MGRVSSSKDEMREWGSLDSKEWGRIGRTGPSRENNAASPAICLTAGGYSIAYKFPSVLPK
jgi:hypothetical protein